MKRRLGDWEKEEDKRRLGERGRLREDRAKEEEKRRGGDWVKGRQKKRRLGDQEKEEDKRRGEGKNGNLVMVS